MYVATYFEIVYFVLPLSDMSGILSTDNSFSNNGTIKLDTT